MQLPSIFKNNWAPQMMPSTNLSLNNDFANFNINAMSQMGQGPPMQRPMQQGPPIQQGIPMQRPMQQGPPMQQGYPPIQQGPPLQGYPPMQQGYPTNMGMEQNTMEQMNE